MGFFDAFGKDAMKEGSSPKGGSQKDSIAVNPNKRQRTKVGYILLVIATGMFVLSLGIGANPFEQWHGILFWGLLIYFCFQKLTDKQFRYAIIATIVGFFILSAIVAAGKTAPYSPSAKSSSDNDVQNTPPDLDPAFVSGMAKKLPPIDPNQTADDRMKVCISIAEKSFASTTNAEQRSFYCQDYANATPEMMQAAQQYFIDVMDNSTPEERYQWCIENREALFGERTIEYAKLVCEQFKDDWQTVKKNILGKGQ